MDGGELHGRCLCGAVTVRVGDHTPEVGACHCSYCRRWTGSAYFAFEAPADAVSIDGPVKTYRSTPFSQRAFCAECGSHIWLRDDGDEVIELMPGLFDDASGMPLVSVVYADRAPAYLPLPKDVRRRTAAEYEADRPHV